MITTTIDIQKSFGQKLKYNRKGINRRYIIFTYNNMSQTLPDNFRATICDFANDLSTTFPEYKYLWEKWSNPRTTEAEFIQLFAHCSTVYPERFFDILNQNAAIFSSESTVATTFLPNVEFKMLYNCAGITDKTRESIWKYLQVIMFLVVGSMKDKMDFGDAMNMFENMNEEDLHKKMEDAMNNIGDFFGHLNDTESAATEQANAETQNSRSESRNTFTDKKTFDDLKEQLSGINEHLRGMFDGKIGRLAKELAEDLGSDFANTLGADFGNARSTKDILAKLMKNPQQISGLVKTVGDKLNQKMASGDISREELLSEAGDMMRKMKDMTGGDGGNMGDMFKNLAKSMGMGMGMGMPNGMGMGMPKGAKLDTNAIAQMEKVQASKDQLRARASAAHQQKEQQAAQQKAVEAQRQAAYDKFMAENPNIFNTDDPNSLVFRLEGEIQEKSSVHRPVTASQKKRMKKQAKKDQSAHAQSPP